MINTNNPQKYKKKNLTRTPTKTESEDKSEWLLFYTKWAIFDVYNEEQVIFHQMIYALLLYYTNTLV